MFRVAGANFKGRQQAQPAECRDGQVPDRRPRASPGRAAGALL